MSSSLENMKITVWTLFYASSMYVIVSGHVSVYIDGKKSGEEREVGLSTAATGPLPASTSTPARSNTMADHGQNIISSSSQHLAAVTDATATNISAGVPDINISTGSHHLAVGVPDVNGRNSGSLSGDEERRNRTSIVGREVASDTAATRRKASTVVKPSTTEKTSTDRLVDELFDRKQFGKFVVIMGERVL